MLLGLCFRKNTLETFRYMSWEGKGGGHGAMAKRPVWRVQRQTGRGLVKAHPCGLGEDQTGDTLGKSNRREGLRRETEGKRRDGEGE